VSRLVYAIVASFLLAGAGLAAPVVTPQAAVTNLDDIGPYRLGYAYRGKPEHDLGLAWSGYGDQTTGISCMPQGVLSGKRALLLHPPWYNGTGIAFQEFTLRIPKCRRVTLGGATALRTEAVGKSDGVTFRVLCNGRKLLDVSRNDDHWKDFSLDLTPFAGSTVTIRFETDPGPKDDTTWDHALWGGRELTLEGFKSRAISQKAPPPLDLRKLYATKGAGVVPPSGFAGKRSVSVRGDTATLRYAGADGVFEYRWRKPSSADPLLGRIDLISRTDAGKSVLPVASGSGIAWTKPAVFQSSRFEHSNQGETCVINYTVGDQRAVVRVAGRIINKSLVLDISCDKPLVTRLDAGGWNSVPIRKQIPVPYYSGQVFYIPSADLFAGAFLDWTTANAFSHETTRANYSALTDGSRNCLRERVVFTAARHLAETLPNIPNPPSPYLKDLGRRVILDIWGGKYVDIASDLEKLSDYGVRDCAAIIHAWQRSGYDNALPAHYPANERLGGDEGMKRLTETARKLGYLVSLHENYVDYYPNYEYFDEKDVALDSEGKRQNGWYNPGTKIQAFATKPNSILPLAATQSPEIHRRYGTNSAYLDVNSAVPPWFHPDCRAGEQGAGRFTHEQDVYYKLWQFLRDTHGGPVFGEGNNHWYWSGYLDGAEAQFGSGWAYAQGRTAPLAVDFDLLRIHPLQLNHGMGYYMRWDEAIGYSGVPDQATLDQYRMQELAYGHAGFLGSMTWNNIPLVWQEYNLVTSLTSRYATARPVSIAYLVNGRWTDATAAAKASAWDRVRVRYDNGLEITANSGAPMTIGGANLPQYGWVARGAGVSAYTALRDGQVVDYAETPDSVFANSRPAPEYDSGKVWDLLPKAGEFEQTGARKFRITYDWQVGEKPPVGYTCFVHFIGRNSKGEDNAICFQGDHEIPDSAWKPGQTLHDGPHDVEIPSGIADGDYKCCLGMFRPDFARLPMRGTDNRDIKVWLGDLHVSDGGNKVTFDPANTPDPPKPRRPERVNVSGKVIDFGSVRTNGSVFIERQGPDWVLTPLPRDRAFTIQLKASKFGCPKGTPCTAGWWRLKMNGAKEYRWKTR
jgi:hypothetical protein